MKRRRLFIALAVILVLAGLFYHFYGGSATPAGQQPLLSLTSGNFEQLRRDSNEAYGEVRVITLLSPT